MPNSLPKKSFRWSKMRLNNLYHLVFSNYLPKICDINSYCLIILKNHKRTLYCFAFNNETLIAYDYDGTIGEYKELNVNEINPYYSIKLLSKPISLCELKDKYDLPF